MNASFQNQSKKRRALRPPASPLPGGGRPIQPVLVAHVVNTLPDSLSRREELLRALADGIPLNEESAVRVRTLQFHLQEHEKLRVEWPSPLPGEVK